MSGWGFIFKILKDANNTGQLGEKLAKQTVKRNRITENLIKNAEKYADNTENADELRRLATQIEQYQDDITDLYNANKVLKNRQGEFVDTPYLDGEYIYTNNDVDARNNIIRNLNEANFLQKQTHYARNDMNALLHEIMLKKQREINPRKLQLDEAIINLDKNNKKRMPVSPENRSYIAKRNDLIDNNKYNYEDNIHKTARDYLDEHDLSSLGFSKFYE